MRTVSLITLFTATFLGGITVVKHIDTVQKRNLLERHSEHTTYYLEDGSLPSDHVPVIAKIAYDRFESEYVFGVTDSELDEFYSWMRDNQILWSAFCDEMDDRRKEEGR